MAYYKDVREYLNALEAAGKLVRVRQSINKDTEMIRSCGFNTAVCLRPSAGLFYLKRFPMFVV